MKKIKILIVEDHTLVRENITLFLNLNEAFEVVGATGDGQEALELAKILLPEIILMDINLNGVISGLDATSMITAIVPEAKIIGLSMHNQPSYARTMMQKGAMGYITKSSSQNEIVDGILKVYSGSRFFCNEIRDNIADQMINPQGENNKMYSLSKRELEILKYIKDGDSSKDIADKLFISTRTAEVHRYNILKKLNLKNSTTLVNYLHQNHYLGSV